MDISLGDLRVTIRSMSTVNLLDSKHYSFTREQLEQSAESGSIAARKGRLHVRRVAPDPPGRREVMIERNGAIIKPLRSQVRIDEPYYEELDLSEEQVEQAQVEYAAEAADLDFEDRAPAGIVVDKKYKETEEES